MISVVVLLVCLTLRILPRILWKDFDGTDSHFHFYYIDLIRKNEHRIPKNEPRVLGGTNDCTYPFFYHWLLSYFPVKFLDFWDKFSGCIFDFLNGVIVLFFLSLIKEVSFDEYCLIMAFYVIAPGLTFSFIGPRPYSLTPRNFSQFVFAISCLFLVMGSAVYSATGVFLFFLASMGFAVLLLSSQFGTQVLFSILLFNFFNLKTELVLLLSVFLSILIFRGFLISQVKAHIFHLEWYFKYNYQFVQHKTNFKKLVKIIKEKNLRGIFYELVFYNQIFTSIFRHPTFFISLFVGLFFFFDGKLDVYQEQIIFLLLPLFVVFVITNFGKARVFGEAERYIEFAYPLQAFLFLSLVSQNYIEYILSTMILYNLIWYSYNLYQIKYQNSSMYSYKYLFSYLKKDNINLLCLSNNESYIFLRNTDVNIIGFLVNISLKGGYRKFFDSFFSNYPLVNPGNLKEICRDYCVTHILENKRIKKKEVVNYKKAIASMNAFSKIYDDERYVLYERAI